MALVQVRPAAQGHARHAVQPAGVQDAGVSRDAGGREAGNVPERDRPAALETVGEPSEPGTEDDPDPRSEAVGQPADLLRRAFGGRGGQASTPASEAVIQVATVPPSMARMPSFERSCRRSGAIPPIPPIWIAIEEKFAKPVSA